MTSILKNKSKSSSNIKIEQPKHVKFPIPHELKLKVGAQVMITKNLDVEGGVVNGARGYFKRINQTHEGSMLVIELMNGVEIEIKKENFEVEENEGTYTCEQYPVILAWATTIHKAQGCTVDCASIDIGSTVFSAGQAYVALSRVKSLSGLYLKKPVKKSSIYAHSKALKFQRHIESTGIQVENY